MRYFKDFNLFVLNEDAPTVNNAITTGINDKLDQATVNTIGKALKDYTESFALRFNFQNDRPKVGDKDLRACLMPESRFVVDELDKVAKTIFTDTILNKVKGLVIEVEGHTSTKGKDAYNKDLSTRRAQIVVDYLNTTYKTLFDKYKITFKTIGYGETQPIITNDFFENGKKITPILQTDLSKLQLDKTKDAELLKQLETNQDLRQAVNRRVYIKLPNTVIKPEPAPIKSDDKQANATTDALKAPEITFNWNSFIPSQSGFSKIEEFVKSIEKFNVDNPNNKKSTLYVITHVRYHSNTNNKEQQDKENRELSYNRAVFLTKMIYQLNPGITVVPLPTLFQIKNQAGCIFDFDANNEVVKKAMGLSQELIKAFGKITIESNYVCDEHLESAEYDIDFYIKNKADLSTQSTNNNYRIIPVEYVYVYNNKYPNDIIANCLKNFVDKGKKAMKSITSIWKKAVSSLGDFDTMKQKYPLDAFVIKERVGEEDV